MLELTESLIKEYLDESITEGYYDRSTGMRVENVWPVVEITIQAGEDFDSFKNILEANKNSIVAACTNSSSYRLYKMTSNRAAKRIIIKITSEPTVWKYYDSNYSLGSSLDQDYSKALFIKEQQVYDEATIIGNIKKLLGTSKAIAITVDYGFYCAANCPSGTYYITEASVESKSKLNEAGRFTLPELDVSKYVLDYDAKNGLNFEEAGRPLLCYGKPIHPRHYQVVYFDNLVVASDKGVQYKLDTDFWDDPQFNNDVCVYTYLDSDSDSLESDMVDSAGRRELEGILKNIFGKNFNIISYDGDSGSRNYAPWKSVR